MINHEDVQAALSARLDGELSVLDDEVVDAHLAACAECSRFWERSLVLSKQLSMVDGDRDIVPPDLSEVIMAEVRDPFLKMEQRRALTLTVGRVALAVMAVTWALWAVKLVATGGEPDPVLASFAAVRFGVALALGLCAWRPQQVVGVLLVVGTMFTFTAGFAVRDAVLHTGEFQPALVFIPLLTSVALVWTWVADRGGELRRAWAHLNADPK